jgi:peptidoglycan/xylan/chitin deacetylase (PgdA/CDA1 family)
MAYKLVYHFFVVGHYMDRYAKLNKMEVLMAKEMYKDTQKKAK